MDSIDLYLVGGRKGLLADTDCRFRARLFMQRNFDWTENASMDTIQRHVDAHKNGMLIARNVTPGYAYDTIREAHRLGVLIEGRKSSTIYAHAPVNPLLEKFARDMDAAIQARDDYRHRMEAAMDERDRFKQLKEKIFAENRGLRRKLYRAQRELQAACADARVDLNDPNLFIVRPSRMMELRLLGRLTNDVTRIVFEIPSEAEYGRMIQKDYEANEHGGQKPTNSVWWKGLRKNLLRACKPNLRGSKRGTIRIINWISIFATEIYQLEQANHNRAYTDTRRTMRAAKSRYVW